MQINVILNTTDRYQVKPQRTVGHNIIVYSIYLEYLIPFHGVTICLTTHGLSESGANEFSIPLELKMNLIARTRNSKKRVNVGHAACIAVVLDKLLNSKFSNLQLQSTLLTMMI